MPALMLRLCVVIVVIGVACSRPVRPAQVTPGPPPAMSELWQDPGDVTTRDLFHGAGGKEHAPRGSTFTFVAEDTAGFSPGFDVVDDRQIEWSVKTGPEAQTEVVASRVLWAIGFHQPPTYYLETWTLAGGRAGVQEAGRFRPDVAGHDVVGDWPWHENPFVGTREFGGLIVANLVLNNWDWKTSNNKIYELKQPVDGVSRRFVVRDLGASLGKYTYPTLLKWFRLRGFGQGTRNDLEGFEQQAFLESVDRDRGEVDFAYRGIYKDVIATVTPEQLRWACERLSRLTDAQWRDAFRAAGYDADRTARYTAKIKEKIAQGLRLSAGAA